MTFTEMLEKSKKDKEEAMETLSESKSNISKSEETGRVLESNLSSIMATINQSLNN